MTQPSRLQTVIVFLWLLTSSWISAAQPKRILLLAGSRSHGAGEHEFRAGCLLLQTCLNQVPGIVSEVVSNGWPSDSHAFNGADAIVIYADGGTAHPAIKPERLAVLRGLMNQGVGLGCAHYGVEVPKGEPGDALKEWIGGYFEMFWSVNPHWTADFTSIPTHPITRGVKPFSINDEWYFHMRFPEGMKGVTPILSAIAPKETMDRPDGPHSGNPDVRSSVAKGEPQVLMWCMERANGGRGYGFTGGHFHKNWANENLRKAVLNATLWIAKAEVPEGGVDCLPTADQLKKNLDLKK
jgi:type 1 glutamine amidotransferase